MSRIHVPQSKKGAGRRRFLRTLAGGAIALPFLELDVVRAADLPKRFVIFTTGEGNLPARFAPAKLANNALQLSEMLQPLAANKQYLNVVSGVSNLLPGLHTSNGHNAPGHTLLCANLVDTTGVGSFDPGLEVSAGMRCLGPSIDHYLASKLGSMEPLNLAIGGSDPGENRMFYKMKGANETGANPEAPLNADPVDAFNANLAGLPGGPATTRADRFRARRSPVLNGVMDSFNSLNKNLGAADKQRVEDHLDALRDLDENLSYVPPVECGNATLDVPPGFSVPGWPDYSYMKEQADMMVDIMVNTLACGARQIVTLQDTAYDGPRFDWLPEGPMEGWHAQVHNDPALGLGFGSNNDNPNLRAGFLYYASVYNQILTRMAAIEEANGMNMLENSVVLWISEFGWGQTHETHDLPIVLAGGAQGRLPMDRHLVRPGATIGDLYTSILQAFDQTDTSFGYDEEAGFNNSGINGLVT